MARTVAADDMHGKVCLVTGATTDIGKEIAFGLAQRGATVALVGRDPRKCEATVDELRTRSGNASIEALVADLSSQEEVRRLASEVTRAYPRLHVLVNNAGAVFTSRHQTADGLEMTFALNHLAPFLLTNLLLDTLKASGPARIVTTSSMAHMGASINFDDLQSEKRYSIMGAYGQSKLANILFTRELAKRLTGTGLTANCFHPGVVASNFGRSNGGITVLIFGLIRPFQISPEKGAETGIYLATSPNVANISGKYFARKNIGRTSSAANDDAAARRLWDVSAALVHLPAESLTA
jgi:NAD(P)-dependent dehydrogenase (short-subunit alcohol dehydrogenase family)